MLTKLNNWIRNWRYAKDRYWRFNGTNDATEIQCVEILKGTFRGLIYHYHQVSVSDDGSIYFSIIIDSKKSEWQHKVCCKKFSDLVRQILMVILYDMLYQNNQISFGLIPGEEFTGEPDVVEEPVKKRTK